MQILIDREVNSTTLVVNGVSAKVAAPTRLLEGYTRNPWLNRRLETVRPPRPIRRPEPFNQVAFRP